MTPMANNKPIDTLKLPAESLFFGKKIYTHFEQGKGLRTVDNATDEKALSKNLVKSNPELTAAVNYAEMLLKRQPSGKDPDTVYIDNNKVRDALSDAMLYKDLCREHCRMLTEKGYGMRRSELKKLDTIDVTTLVDYAHKERATMPSFPVINTPEYMAYALKNAGKADAVMCMFVPPFTDFVYKLQRDRYLHVKLEEVSVEELSLKLFVQDYTVQETLWIPGTKGYAEITFDTTENGEHNSHEMTIHTYGECCNPHDINVYLNLDELGWNRHQQDVWLDKDRTYTQHVMEMLKNGGTSSCLELMKYALMCNCVTNYMLYGNKPKIVREPSARTAHTNAPAANTPTKDSSQTERRVRYIGTVKVVSTSIPREATPDRVRHYKTAVWKARGGIRHMKDGRTIPFKESIRYRHKLKDTMSEQELAQTVLKLHDNSHIACENEDMGV